MSLPLVLWASYFIMQTYLSDSSCSWNFVSRQNIVLEISECYRSPLKSVLHIPFACICIFSCCSRSLYCIRCIFRLLSHTSGSLKSQHRCPWLSSLCFWLVELRKFPLLARNFCLSLLLGLLLRLTTIDAIVSCTIHVKHFLRSCLLST